jgi:hypothetical protein
LSPLGVALGTISIVVGFCGNRKVSRQVFLVTDQIRSLRSREMVYKHVEERDAMDTICSAEDSKEEVRMGEPAAVAVAAKLGDEPKRPGRRDLTDERKECWRDRAVS